MTDLEIAAIAIVCFATLCAAMFLLIVWVAEKFG